MADFMQAVKWMEEGEKVKRDTWSEGYWALDCKRGYKSNSIINEKNQEENIHYYNIIAENWVICKKTLSDKIFDHVDVGPEDLLHAKHVKQFITDVKEIIATSEGCRIGNIFEQIDEAAGDSLK